MTVCQCGAAPCITALCGDVCVFFSCVSCECGFVSVACVAKGLLTLDDGQLRHRLNMQAINNTVLYWRTKKTTHLTMKSSPQEDKLPTQIIYMGWLAHEGAVQPSLPPIVAGEGWSWVDVWATTQQHQEPHDNTRYRNKTMLLTGNITGRHRHHKTLMHWAFLHGKPFTLHKWNTTSISKWTVPTLWRARGETQHSTQASQRPAWVGRREPGCLESRPPKLQQQLQQIKEKRWEYS